MGYYGPGADFVTAWQRAVNIFRQEQASNVVFVWCPIRAPASDYYPGDEWVDWICAAAANDDTSGNYCGSHSGWCEFEELFHNVSSDVYNLYGDRKPFMAADTGSVEDPIQTDRKGHWFVNAHDAILARMPGLHGISFHHAYDPTINPSNLRIDTSASAVDGFRMLALDGYFNPNAR
jgi:hypothetical protein